MEAKSRIKSAVTYRMIAEALFENYESIYDIHTETNAFKTYFQSDSYQELKLAKEGSDFFEALPVGIYRAIAPEDCGYVLQMLNKNALLAGLKKEKYYQLVYKINRGDTTVYHQLRATLQEADDGLHILMGIKNIDDLVRQRIEHENRVESMEEELRMIRIRNSTSQMQPHFLYNALGSIQELILIDPQYASDLLGDFMIHLRSCVRAMTGDDPIRFSEELKNIRAYVNIEKMRLGDRLEMVYDIETENFPVLPLVENAIRHGIHKRGKNGGRVTLRTREHEKGWIVEVEDTGVGFDVGRISKEVKLGMRDSTGLMNIRFRLDKVMGAVMEIQSTEGEGTTVTVYIPKKGGEGNESDYRR